MIKKFIPSYIFKKTEHIFFAFHAFKLLASKSTLSSNIRFAIAPMLEFAKISYKKGSDFGFLKVDNSSGGISNVIIELAVKYKYKNSENWLLISEPKGTGKTLSDHLKVKFNIEQHCLEIDSILGTAWDSGDFSFDLCRNNATVGITKRFDVVISQALIEHVFDPVEVIRNLILLLKQNTEQSECGILLIHTHNPLMPLHRWPIDTLRYHDDWFISLENYLPLTLLEINTQGHSVFAVFRIKPSRTNRT